MIRSIQLVKASTEGAESYCIVLQAGKNVMLAEGTGRQGAETSRMSFPSEKEAIENACTQIAHFKSLGFVNASSKNPFLEYSGEELPVFQDWGELDSLTSMDEVADIANGWNWDHFLPKRDTLPLRQVLTKLEGMAGIGTLHHQCTALGKLYSWSYAKLW